MPYVMVPVPEEHVQDVMSFVLRAIARASIVDWDAEAFGRFVEQLDEPTRALLSFTARSVLAGDDLLEEEAVRAVQLSGRELRSIVREVNELARDENRPAVITRRVITEELPNGRTTERAVYTMEEAVAELVRDADRADLAAERSRLEETGG